MNLLSCGQPIPELDWEMPVEVMRDFDTVLLFGKLSAVSQTALTVRRASDERCFPAVEERSAVLVRCYDTKMDPVLLCARVTHSSGVECTVGELEMIPYKTRRKSVRYPLCPPTAVSVLDNGAPEGSRPCQMLNISDSGACIVTAGRYAVGQTLQLRAELMEKGEPASFLCRVVRVTPRRGDCFEYGLLFEHLNKRRRSSLMGALQGLLRVCAGVRGGGAG